LDRDFIERAQDGDREAFAFLARTHADRLMAIAQRVLRDVERAEDAVPQTLVIAWRELPSLRDSARRGGLAPLAIWPHQFGRIWSFQNARTASYHRPMIRDRNRVRRQPVRGRYDRPAIDVALDAGLMARVAIVDRGHPYAVPVMYARVGDRRYVRGSPSSRVVPGRERSVGVPDGLDDRRLVLARSTFECFECR